MSFLIYSVFSPFYVSLYNAIALFLCETCGYHLKIVKKNSYSYLCFVVGSLAITQYVAFVLSMCLPKWIPAVWTYDTSNGNNLLFTTIVRWVTSYYWLFLLLRRLRNLKSEINCYFVYMLPNEFFATKTFWLIRGHV